MDQLIKRMIWGFLSIDLALLSIRHLPDTHQTPSRHLSDTFQTPSRHLTDTSQTPENGGFWAIAGHWQKRNQLTLLLLQKSSFMCTWYKLAHCINPRVENQIHRQKLAGQLFKSILEILGAHINMERKFAQAGLQV